MEGLWTIATLTFNEARRRRILLAAFVLGLAFLAIFGTGFFFVNRSIEEQPGVVDTQRRIVLNFVVMAALYAVNFLTVMASVLVPVDTLSGEIDSGVIQTIVTKPIRRWTVVLGKWLGFLAVLALYITFMAGGVLLLSLVIAGFVPPHIERGIPMLFLESAFLMSASIAGGTRLSTLANGVFGFGLYGIAFIGGWMEQIGTRLGSGTTRDVGIIASLVVPTESLWHLAAYHMQPPVMRDVSLTPFSPVSVPSVAMIWWTVGYIAVLLLVALWQLRTRDL